MRYANQAMNCCAPCNDGEHADDGTGQDCPCCGTYVPAVDALNGLGQNQAFWIVALLVNFAGLILAVALGITFLALIAALTLGVIIFQMWMEAQE